jgi:hypothetical protein
MTFFHLEVSFHVTRIVPNTTYFRPQAFLSEIIFPNWKIFENRFYDILRLLDDKWLDQTGS